MSIIRHKLNPYKAEKLNSVNKIENTIINTMNSNINSSFILLQKELKWNIGFIFQFLLPRTKNLRKYSTTMFFDFWKNLCGQQKELTRNHFCKITSDKLRPHTILLCNLGQFLSFEWKLTLNRNKFLAHRTL